MKTKGDVIEKAAELIAQNACVKVKGEWYFINEQLELSYRITRNSCECASFYFNNQGRQYIKPCKHILLAMAPKVVLFIVKMRQCQTLDALMLLVETEAPRIANELPEFIGLANHEYHLAAGRLEYTPEQPQQEQEPVAKKVKQAKFKSRSVRKNGESLTIMQRNPEQTFHGSIQIS